MDSPSLGLRLGAEALGTFLFFFLGFNAVAVSVDIGAGAIDSLGIAFAFGLGLALAITAFGHISGGHFNPARSVDPAVFNGNFDDLWIYLVGPLVGGVLGGVCWNLFGPTPENEPETIRATGGLPQSGETP